MLTVKPGWFQSNKEMFYCFVFFGIFGALFLVLLYWATVYIIFNVLPA